MTDAEMDKVEEIWVNTAEGSEITGYDQQYLQKLALKISRQPEEKKAIRVRTRAGRHELWLPDLLEYMQDHRHSPRNPKQNPSD
jgi:hypothetical protein